MRLKSFGRSQRRESQMANPNRSITSTEIEGRKPKSGPKPIAELPICQLCGSDRVVRDAWAAWNNQTQNWELSSIFDRAFCQTCEAETNIEWRSTPLAKSERIARLNDALRFGNTADGQIMITAGIQAFGPEFVLEARRAVVTFNEFNVDNDPHGEHDFGSFSVAGHKLFFKIDAFDLTMQMHSPDAADPRVTKRVLTIMLASEY
jgi:uncharacterized protein DUF3768